MLEPSAPPARAPLSRGYAGVALAAASWGTWSIFLRLAQAAAPIAPQLSTFVVMATIMIVLAPLAARATQRRSAPRAAREWLLIAIFGISDALNVVLYFGALQTTSVSVAVLTHYLAPLLVALSAPLVLGEPRRPGTLSAVLIGLGGLTLLLAPWNAGAADQKLLLGAGMGLLSAVFFAAGVLFNKRLARSFEPAELIVYHLPSALVVLVLLMPSGGWTLSASGALWLVLGALGPGAIAGVVFAGSLRGIPAAHTSVLTLVEPLTAITIAALSWGEALGPTGLAGAAAILGAGYLVVREARPAPLTGAIAQP